MPTALLRAFAALPTPPLRRAVLVSLAIAIATFVLLSLGAAVCLDNAQLFGWAPLNWLLDILGALGVLALSWLLFPAVVTLVMGFFLDGIAAAVEARDYPGQPPARRAPLREIVATTLRLMGLTILLNLLALPLYILMPGINLFLFLALNGYLFGREYFEVVALRRLDTMAARALRRRFGAYVFLGGVIVAGLFALPLVNLVAPVIATAFMVHVFHGLRAREPQLLAR
jgi:CysZ protein